MRPGPTADPSPEATEAPEATETPEAPEAIEDDTLGSVDPRRTPPGLEDGAVEEELRKNVMKAKLFGQLFEAVHIGRFKVIEQLGSGGMGVVYSAYDEQLDRRVAIKVLRSNAADPGRTVRLVREAKSMARLSHPNVVAVHEVGTWQGRPFLAMEFVKGKTAREWLLEQKPGWREIRDVYCGAARGLAAAHEVGMVHRDFKPDNVLVGDDGRARVADFGLAGTTDPDAGTHDDSGPSGDPGSDDPGDSTPCSAGSLTATGTILGTPAYMSAEQHAGRQTDHRSDQFSLCVALYEALYRTRPFSGKTTAELAAHVRSGSIASAPDRGVPPWLRAVVVRGLSPEPARRWPSTQALIEALEVDPGERRRQRLRLSGLVAVILAAIIGLGWLVKQAQDDAALERLAKAEAQAQRDRAYQQAKDEALRARDAARVAAAREHRHDPTTVIALLRELEAPEAVRGWATLAQSALLEPMAERVLSHDGAVRVMALSPDGRFIATASSDHAIWIWPMDRAGAPRILRGHSAAVRSIEFAPDGRRLVSASDDGVAMVWVPGQSEPVIELRGHEAGVTHASFSRDGARVVTSSRDNRARVFTLAANTATVSEGHTLEGHTQAVRRGLFTPDGRKVVTSSEDGTARVWHIDGDGRSIVLAGHTDQVRWLAVSPDGARIATASRDGTARLWTVDGEPAGVLEGHDTLVYSIRFSPAGDRVVTASADRSARVWRVDGTEPPVVLRGHSDQVFHAEFGPDGSRILTASFDQTARLWRADGHGVPSVLAGHARALWRARFSLDGARAVTISDDRSARIWRLTASSHPITIATQISTTACPIFSPDGARLAATGIDGSVKTWTVDRSGAPVILGRHAARVLALAFSPDGSRLVTASLDTTAAVWSLDPDAQPVTLRGHRRPVTHASFSPDGARILTAAADGSARLWSPDDGAELRVIQGALNSIMGAAFSPDGASLATWSPEDPVTLWPVEQDGGSPRVFDTRAEHAAFSPDGSKIAVGARGRMIGVWRRDGAALSTLHGEISLMHSAAFSPTGEHLLLVRGANDPVMHSPDDDVARVVLSGHEDAVQSAHFSPDGRRLVTGADDSTARVWPVDQEAEPIILAGHDASVDCVRFSPDSAAVLTAARDGTMRLWRDIDGWRLTSRRLWQATHYCIPVAERRRFLGLGQDRAERDRDRCLRRVAGESAR